MSAISASPGRMPARASTTNSATCASASAARAWSWIETASGSSSSRSTPPVSISVKLRPFQSVASSLRSRVMPGPLVHDRLAALREPVDERGLADVRIADDRDLHAWISLASIASVTTWSTTSSSVSPVVSTGHGVRRAARASSGWPRSRAGRARAGASSTSASVRPEVGGAAARALGRIGVEEDLDRGVGRDDGADVAALGDPVARRRRSPAACAPARRAPRGRRRPCEASLGHARRRGSRRSRRGRRSAPARRPRSRSARRPRRRARRSSRGGEADAAVHRPGVQVREAEPCGDGARDRGLSGPGGTVDGDDHGARP